MKKNIRSKSVKESLLDYNNLAATLKENTQNAVKDLLAETVRNTYNSLLNESDDEDEYKEEEVEDTNDALDNDVDDEPETDEVDTTSDDTEMDSDSTDEDDVLDDDSESEEILTDDDSIEDDLEADDEDDSEAWGEFDKYQVGDGQYDFSKANDEELVKVYKLLKNDDQVMVLQKGDHQVEIKDNETGSEYIIDMGGDDDTTTETDIEISLDDEPTNETDNFDTMKESTERLYELVLEYDSNVGYTDNYQKKDVMTTPSMEEPGKGNDWDKGVPHGKDKPWSGYPSKKKKADAPFNAGKGKQVEESLDLDDAEMINDEEQIEEHVHRGAHKRMTGVKFHATNSKGADTNQGGGHVLSKEGEYEGTKRFDESYARKVNAILKENKALKRALGEWKTTLQEAAVTNLNLGQIIKLISENTTSTAEKKEIIARFGKEAKTVEQSKNLFEAISNDLKKNRQMNPLNEEKTITATGSKMINETQIYQSNDLLESLDLMHRLCK